ncbi:MAG: aldehyde dehydrogenase family protein, partial [Chloroflexota bacterium]|nr:aldehyde dehydrogenase family protein [Chloroflexota bacterium]
MTAALRNYIGGEWVESASGETFDVFNPATGEIMATGTASKAVDVDRAVRAARAAYDKWRLYPAPKRGEILYRAGEIMVARKEELAREMTREMGKVVAESRGDVQEGIDMVYYTAGEGRRQFGDVVPAELPNKWAMSMRHPLGVVAAITPWNFPFAIPTWKIMPALILGNTVVFKPASYTPILATRLVEIMEEVGLPKGVLNLLLGSGADVGDALVTHPGVDLVSFTGSSDTGAHIGEQCGRLLKRASCELGGKNAIVVLDDADMDLSIDGIVWSAFGTSGQRCTAASRVIAHRSVAGDLVDKLVSRAKGLRLGDGLEASTDVGPVVSDSALEKIHSYIPIAEREGATVAAGGHTFSEGPLSRGYFHEPTVLTDVKPFMRVAQEEIFGPVTAVIEVKNVDEAITVLNGTKYGLSCSLYTRDVNTAFRFMRDAETGLVYVNAGTIGA